MAKSFVRRASKIFFISLNVLVIALFLLACLCPYISSASLWLIGFVGLIVPYLATLLILFTIFWLVAKPRIALFSFVALLVGIQQLYVLFAVHMTSTFNNKKEEAVLRIVDWNVQSFNGLTKNREAKKMVRNEIAESIAKLNPDVICLQEFNTATNGGEQADNIALFTKNYPYYFFSKDYQRSNGKYQSGCIIFSRYPIIRSERTAYPVAESLIYADIVKGADTVRVYTTHLQSFKFKKEDYEGLDNITNTDDASVNASMNVFKKMRLAFGRRGKQTEMVKTETGKSPYPSIVCGDFNDVPNSNTYFKIKGNRQDAFLKQHFGIGRTYIWLAPTLRIDYILPDKNFEVKQFDLVDEDLSDHLMLVSDLKLKTKAQ